MYSIRFPIDHIAFSTSDRPAAEAMLHKLGFVFGDTAKDAFLHLLFDNGYLEWVPADYDASQADLNDAKELTAGIRAFYAAINDAEAAYAALNAAGYPAAEPGSFTRYAKHGVNHGMATFRFTGLLQTDLFGKGISLGCVHQCDPQLIYEGHYRHVNDADTVKAFVFVCADPERTCRELTALRDAMEDCLTPVNAIAEIHLLSREEYAKTFGCPAPETETMLAAVLFSAADQNYLTCQLEALQIPHFAHDGRLYADLRRPLGAFFVFDGEK